MQTARIDLHHGNSFSLALGFGTTQSSAVATAGKSATTSFDQLSDAVPRRLVGVRQQAQPARRTSTASRRRSSASLYNTYYLSANVLKASEDKTFPGAIVASLASPWGQAVSAGDPANTYFGSYREVFARDLYETFTGLVAAGDIGTAKDTVRFLFNRQQQPDGSIPRNSLVNGKTAPDSFGIQLDEVAYPILMARTVGLTGQDVLPAAHQEGRRLPRRARTVVRIGALGGAERLLPVDHLGGDRRPGGRRLDRPARRRLQWARGSTAPTADEFQRSIKKWTLTTNGPLSSSPYFIRLSKTGDPNAAITYNLGNGGPDADQR